MTNRLLKFLSYWTNKSAFWHIEATAHYVCMCVQSFQIVLAATLKSSFASDIAVDDIRVFNCTDPEFQSKEY